MKNAYSIKRVGIIALIVAMVLGLTSCGNKNQEDGPAGNTEAVDIEVDEIQNMPIKDKISQLLITAITFSGEGDDTKGVTEINDNLEKVLKKYHLGGVILFNPNIENAEQTAKLINDLQRANKEGGSLAGLFIAADQEGGLVARLTTGTQMPGNMAIGATFDSEKKDATYASEAGELMGKELRSLGFNLNFAPVLDVNNNPGNPIIGVRSFSDDPETVGVLGNALINGLHKENIITAIKHFPGHGNTDVDSHTGLPLIGKPYDELLECEIIPFREAMTNADMVMSAHIQFPDLGTETYTSKETGEEIFLPATLSYEIITDVLRNEMGFEGVVITDAMDMEAITTHFDKLDATKLAINAGVDMILVPVTDNTDKLEEELDEYIEGVAKLVESGEIPEERLDESIKRVFALKEKYGLMVETNGDVETEESIPEIGTLDNHSIEWEMATKGVTIVKGTGEDGADSAVLPIARDSKVLVAVPYESEVNSISYGVEMASEFLRESLGEAVNLGDNVTTICYGDIQKWDFDSLLGNVDTVIGISALYAKEELNPNTEDGIYTKFLDDLIAEAHKRNKKFLLISAQLPYDLARFQEADALMACYNAKGMSEIPNVDGSSFDGDFPGFGPNIPAAIFVAFGGEGFGHLPVDIPKINDDYTYSEEILYERGYGLNYEI